MRDAREDLAPKLLATFVALSLFYYGYVYLYAFDEGVSEAPEIVKAVKDFAYLALVVAITFVMPWKRTPLAAWAFVPFGLALAATAILHSTHTSLSGQLREPIKNTLIYIPVFTAMFLLSPDHRAMLTNWFFRILVFAAVVQSLFSIVYTSLGGTLWDGGLYVGFISNPNSFALMLNMSAAVILAFLPRLLRPAFVTAVLFLAGITYVNLHTTSGSQFVILCFLVPYAALLTRRSWGRYLVVALAMAGTIWLNGAAFESTSYTMANMDRMVTGAYDPTVSETDDISRSVRLRAENIKLAFSVLAKGPTSAILGDFDARAFTPMDGQFWLFLYNNGSLTALLFSIAAAWVYLLTFAAGWNGSPSQKALNMMIAAFGITCIASRIIMYFPFNFIFFLVAGLAVARSMEGKMHAVPKQPVADDAVTQD